MIYNPTEARMKFGEAIEAAKLGHRIQRAGWNGKGMWVAYVPPSFVKDGMAGIGEVYLHSLGITGDLRVGGYFVMWTADQVFQPGWLASQADMLAEDWTTL